MKITNYSWQEAIDRIQSIKNKKKKLENNFENNSVESMDQFAFRGLKQRGLIAEKVII